MDIINIQAMKGGSGTTTIAVALAALLNENNSHLRIGVHANKHRSDVQAVAGISGQEDIRCGNANNITLLPNPHGDNIDLNDAFDIVIVDNGHIDGDPLTEPNPHGDTHNIYIVRSDYLSLRRGVRVLDQLDKDGIWVARTNKDGALGFRDVADVLGVNLTQMVEIPDDPKVGRAVDAGVLLRRVPDGLKPLFDGVCGPGRFGRRYVRRKEDA